MSKRNWTRAGYNISFSISKEDLEKTGFTLSDYLDIEAVDGAIVLRKGAEPEHIKKHREEVESQCRDPIPRQPDINNWEMHKEFLSGRLHRCYIRITLLRNPRLLLNDLIDHLKTVYGKGTIKVFCTVEPGGYESDLFEVSSTSGRVLFKIKGWNGVSLPKGVIARRKLENYLGQLEHLKTPE